MGTSTTIDFKKQSSITVNDILPAYGTNFTVDLWMKLNSLTQTDYATLFMRGNSTTANGVHIFGNKLGVRRSESSSLGKELEPLSNLSINTWYRLTFTYNGSSFNYYRDGVLINSVPMTGSFSNATDKLTLGDWRESYGAYLDGSLHDFKFFNRALESDESLKLYENRTYTTPFDSALLIQLKLDGNDKNVTKVGTYTLDSFNLYNTNKSLIFHDGVYKKYTQSKISDISTNLVPVMTSATAPSGEVITSGSYDTGRSAWKAFNGSVDVYTQSWASSSLTPSWLGYVFPIPVTVNAYSITSPSNHSTIGEDCMPNSWILQGSNDGSDWVDLDQRDNETGWGNSEKRTYVFSSINGTAYRYYRIYITANNRTSSKVTYVSELELYEATMSKKIGWETVSSSLPTTNQFIANGSDSLSPLLDRKVMNLDAQAMTSKIGILPVESTAKVFSKKLSLDKYIDVRKIEVK